MKLTHSHWIVLFFSLTLVAATSQAKADEPLCESYASEMLGKTVTYCVDRTHPDQPMKEGEPVAYFMHGTNGDASTWTKNHYADSLRELRAGQDSIPAMTFISFDTSRYSFFMDKPGDPTAAYETWLIKEFIPYIESIYPVCNQKSCRSLIGESMGGFGALKTSFRHADFFHAVAVNSPALPPFSIWVRMRTWLLLFTKPHRIGPIMGDFLIKITRNLMPTENEYEAQNPIELASNLPLSDFPSLYFDMGGRDKYGFEVGYWIFKELLDQRQVAYETHFEPKAGHDMWMRHAGDAIQFLLSHSGKPSRN
jgi:S-formylglutathione hydrolase FrmB